MRLFWKLLLVLGGLLLVVVVAVGITIRTFDANDLMGPIQQRVRDTTGRELTIRGGAELKLGLEPKLVINDVALGNAPWGTSAQLLTAKRIEADVALLPLLRRRVDIVRFSLIEPTIALETDAQGKGNWELAGARPPSTGSNAAERAINGLAIGDLAIDNGTLTFRDGGSGKVTNIAIDTLTLHARDPQSPISAQFRGTIDDIAVSLEGDLGPVEALVQRRWPYSVSLQGNVNGQKASVSTQVQVEGTTAKFGALKIETAGNNITGQAALTRSSPRNKFTFNFSAPTYTLAALTAVPAGGGADRAIVAVKAGAGSFVFRDEPVPIGLFNLFDADGELAIGQLILADGRHLDNVHVVLHLQSGRLELPVLQASMFGGTASGKLSLDSAQQPAPAFVLHMQGKGLELGAILAALGRKGEVRNGPTDFTVDIEATGQTPRQWATSMSGTALLSVGPATLVNAQLGLDSALNRLGAAINPFHNVDPSTELQCAVVRLPLHSGIAQIDNSIGLETNKFGATASGTLDFRSETMDLSIRPQVRAGVSLSLPQVADLVRFRGPFAAPVVVVDSVATAKAIARLGAAAYSGGWSVLAESLLKATGSGAGSAGSAPCKLALGAAGSDGGANSNRTDRPVNSPTASERGVPVLDDVAKALGRAINR